MADLDLLESCGLRWFAKNIGFYALYCAIFVVDTATMRCLWKLGLGEIVRFCMIQLESLSFLRSAVFRFTMKLSWRVPQKVHRRRVKSLHTVWLIRSKRIFLLSWRWISKSHQRGSKGSECQPGGMHCAVLYLFVFADKWDDICQSLWWCKLLLFVLEITWACISYVRSKWMLLDCISFLSLLGQWAVRRYVFIFFNQSVPR